MKKQVILDNFEERLVVTGDNTRLGLVYTDKLERQTAVILLNPKETKELIDFAGEVVNGIY